MSLYEDLLQTWCDRLLELQRWDAGHPLLEGGVLCPACGLIHGRSQDLVYPFLYMAEKTGRETYLRAAKGISQWAFANVSLDDGSFLGEKISIPWRGITVFAVVAYVAALQRRSHLLDAATRKLWEERILQAATWCYAHVDFAAMVRNNVNYPIACAAALALAGTYFDREEWRMRAGKLGHQALDYFTEEGLLFGEGAPMDARTAKGCRPVDIGYDVEESLPLLALCAHTLGDTALLAFCRKAMVDALDFFLPDGGWDNSFGSRNFKWSYWGSRTSDGCQSGFALFAEAEPMLREAALRSAALYRRCTADGLLHGGPDYAAHGIAPCTQHSIYHAKGLAMALDLGLMEPQERIPLPCDTPAPPKHYPSLDSWRVSEGPWLATLTGYDFEYVPGGHSSGGALSLLYHRTLGPLIAAGMTRYWMPEPGNMQFPQNQPEHRPLVPRLESADGRFSQMFDYSAELTKESDGSFIARFTLVDEKQQPLSPSPAPCIIRYAFTEESLTLSIDAGPHTSACRFVLPLLCRAGDRVEASAKAVTIHRENGIIRVQGDSTMQEPRRIFNLIPGFEGLELVFQPGGQPLSLHITCEARKEDRA